MAKSIPGAPGWGPFFWSVVPSLVAAAIWALAPKLPAMLRVRPAAFVAAVAGVVIGTLGARYARSWPVRSAFVATFVAAVVVSSHLPSGGRPHVVVKPVPGPTLIVTVTPSTPVTDPPTDPPTDPSTEPSPVTETTAPSEPTAAATFSATRMLDDSQLLDVLLTETDAATVIPNPSPEAGRDRALFWSDPSDLTLCDGARYKYRDLVSDVYLEFDADWSNALGAEASTFRSDGAANMLSAIAADVERCPSRVRYDKKTTNGRVLALVVPVDDEGYTRDWIFIRRGRVVAQVVLVSEHGSHSADADAMAEVVIERLERALS